MVRYLPLILKNTLRNRRRSFLTVCSIAASLCLLGILMAIYHAFFLKEAPPSQALRLVTRHRVSLTQSMPMSYEAKIRSIPGVREVMTWQWFGGTYKDARDRNNFFARFAVETPTFFTVRGEIQLPEDQKQAFLHERTACIIGRDKAAALNLKVGDRIALQGDIFPINLDLTLRGIYENPDDNDTLYFHQDYLRESMAANSRRRDQVGAFQILADSAESVPRISKAVDDMFDNATAQTKTESEQAFGLSFVSFLGNVKMFLMSIFGAVTFTILLVSANTMAMSVRERIREVGILKTLGFTPGAILGIILGEAAVIAVVGGVLGLALAAGMTAVIRSGPAFMQALKTLTIAPSVALVSLLLAVVIGVGSSLIPAWNAARTPILDSLRDAG